ncbi:pyruvate, phosphate dikinase [Candidatus Woesearchaeota archaeon]|nr:pyruvate, phosphate dikinase [Candidatus Woesearchaeota archaeon]
MAEKYIYDFEEGKADMKFILGGKGANLAEMTNMGVPVPPGFIVSIKACNKFYEDGKKISEEIIKEYTQHLEALEKKMGKKLGDNDDPLLISVRSGAAVSMPGMMDTVLNLGLTDKSVLGLANKTGNERFAWDAYRRFMQMFGNVIMEIKGHEFEKILEGVKKAKGVELDTELDAADLKNVVQKYEAMVKEKSGKEFPQDPREQLRMGIEAVFRSWGNPRADLYRKLNNIPKEINGTAVNCQVMVFGNKGETSGTGVCFSRDPSTGENVFYGEYLMNAQGEDVVAGVRTPQKIATLEEQNKEAYDQLVKIKDDLEKHYTDMQDMEFTIEEGKLYILQTRNGKRTAHAAVRIAVEMVSEGLIDEKKAVLRVDPASLDQLLHKQLDPKAKKTANVLTKGLPASPGAAVGKVCFDAQEAHELNEKGEKVVLTRVETSPEDLIGMNAAQGILTSRGGMTSHAAVVARGMGKCCVAGCHDAIIDEEAKTLTISGKTFKEGDFITLDGSSGEVMEGALATVDPELSGNFGTLMEWADKYKKLQVKTNADTPHDAEVAVKFGAEGIGLCRTEHMFFEESRIKAVREMIVAKELDGRKKALDKLEPFQQEDFEGLFKVLDGKPVIIRLLDPPLHEFLPKEEEDIKNVAKEVGVTVEALKETIASLHEFNPMLGFRGCRLGVKYPEITEMQARAIFKAAKNVSNAEPWIEVPLAGNVKEFKMIKDIILKVAKELGAEGKVNYKIGSMIEVPRAALTADEFAPECDFFSFGTNDLTQMTCGFSRDDAGSFLGKYVDSEIYDRDPFQAIDQTGVGKLMEHAIKLGRSVKPELHIGICGEHGGEPSSVEFCHKIGLNEVSCSPFRVPIARLAAAHAALKQK